MPRITGTSHRQTLFLRSLAKHPEGPPPSEAPSPLLLRRWLKKPRFRVALNSLQKSIAAQRRLELSFTSLAAARTLHEALIAPPAPNEPKPNEEKKNQTQSPNDSTDSPSPPPAPSERSKSNAPSDLRRKLCNDVFRAIRPRGPRSKRPIVLAPAPFDDCLNFLKRLHKTAPLGEALEYYIEQRDLCQKAYNEKRGVPAWLLEAEEKRKADEEAKRQRAY